MFNVWMIWLLLLLLSFIGLESYAGATKQLTLSQTMWEIQDKHPWATLGLAIFMIGLLWHLTLHRIYDLSWWWDFFRGNKLP